jgi:hypothetical protein
MGQLLGAEHLGNFMSVHIVECARGEREGGFILVSLDYEGSNSQHAIDYVRDHKYRPKIAREILSPEQIPPRVLAICYSFKMRKRVAPSS